MAIVFPADHPDGTREYPANRPNPASVLFIGALTVPRSRVDMSLTVLHLKLMVRLICMHVRLE